MGLIGCIFMAILVIVILSITDNDSGKFNVPD